MSGNIFAFIYIPPFKDGASDNNYISYNTCLLYTSVIYRVAHVSHHNTGDKWCIYPMYDFAHPIEDAIEGISHSLCTLEFEDHRPLYDWVVRELEYEIPPRQIEFAKMYVTNVITGKRYIKKLVEDGVAVSYTHLL